MTVLSIYDYPKAILHVDGDAFFASCAQALNPKLKGKPVVTGSERGIATAISYEARAFGVKRGMRAGEIRRLCPDCFFVSSDYESYSLFSLKMYSLVRQFTPTV
ncbi:DNA polymerase IV, partial [Patescibacteria group bacterium]|nr:DNA polymerase IV [Patescibacteria group bacterium]